MRRNTTEKQQAPEGEQEHSCSGNYQIRKSHKTSERQSVLKRFCNGLSFVKYIAVILIVPPILNYGALKREADALFPQGEKVDVGWGQMMFISCLGEGIPTVILDAPTGSSSDVWIETQKQIAKFTKVCIYDRSGIGFSDLPFTDVTVQNELRNARRYVAQPATVHQMVDDLHYLVTNSKPLLRPFILVGSEIGSLTARYYGHLYPKDVVGIVLIDPLVENLFTVDNGAWNEYWYSLVLPSLQSMHLAAILGVSRLALLVGWLHPPLPEDNIAQEVMFRKKYLLCNPTHLNAAFNEHLFMNTSFSQMNDLLRGSTFPQTISVTVINSKYYEKYPKNLNEAWKKSQHHLVENLHRGCYQKTIECEEHSVLYSKPRAITEQIQKLIRTWQEQQKMSFSFVN